MLDRSAVLTRIAGVIALAMTLGGCGGSKILKEPKALELQGPLVAESDSTLAVGLEWVIVRDGPGTWARNADWDEYLFHAHNLSSNDVTIERIVLYDSLETMIASNSNRGELVKGTRAASRRYKDQGLEVRAGLGGAGLAAAGAASYVGGMTLGASVLAGAGAGASAGIVAVGAILAAPALLAGGVVRGVRNSNVGKEIENRHTDLPFQLRAGEELPLHAFFPLSPSPVKVQINYRDAAGMRVLTINTAKTLDGLHLRAPGSR